MDMQVALSSWNRVTILSRDHWVKIYSAARGGKYPRELDKALPGVHTKALYKNLTRPKATISAQMRTGKCKLRSCLHAIGAENSILCECRQMETVKRVLQLLDCKLWQAERKELGNAVRNKSRRGDIPFLLAGLSGEKRFGGKVH